MQLALAKTVVFFREPNPILVRELKQFVRNRLLLYFMLFYLALISLVTVIVLALPDIAKLFPFRFFDECDGPELFAFLMLCYYILTSGFLVLFGSIKLGYERYKNDLGYYTTVAPWRIISGKFLLGVTVSLIFLSLLMPFLTIAYMMRGLDLTTIVYAVLFFFFMSLVHYSVTITFFAGARTLTRIYLFGLILAFLQLIGLYCGLIGSYSFIYYPEFIGANRYYVMIPYLIQWAFILFPLPFAVCQVSPESSNRMMPVRICMTLFFLIVAAAFTGTMFYTTTASITPESIEILGMCSAITMACIYIFYPIIYLIFVCEREKYSVRQRRAVPKNGLLRFLYFLHATGVANAICWYFLFIVINIGLFFFWYIAFEASDSRYNELHFFVSETFWRLLPFGMMVFCWGTGAFFLWKSLLHKFLPREWLSFPLLCFGVIVFIFYCVCMAAMPYDAQNMVSIGFSIFPIVVFEKQGVMVQYFFGVVGTLFITLLTSPKIFDAMIDLAPCDAPKILTESELQEAVRLAGDGNFSELPDEEIIESAVIEPDEAQS